MKHLEFSLVCAALVIGGLSLVEADTTQQGRSGRPAPDPSLCLDEAGSQYSKDAMRKVNGQIQRCDGGNRWLASSADGTRDAKAAATAPGKDCIGTHKEAYESGLYRQVEKYFERCDNGKWVPERR